MIKLKKIKVLLVYPQIPPTYWSFKYALSFVGKKSAIPPLGLLTVAALLPPSYEIKLVDMNVSSLTDEMILEADLIFTSAMIVQKNSLAELAERCQRLGATLVAGGPYPSSSYAKIKNVNFFVLNEAEITLPQFLHDWEMGQAKHIYEDHGKADITNSPVPRFDLLPSLNHYEAMPLQYSRGCPFNCEFCDIIEMFGRQIRTKTNQQMLKELTLLYHLDWRGSVFIVDDNFIGNKRNVKQLLPAIAKWQKERNYPFTLFTEASINLAEDEALLNLMCEAGFNMVFVGIETPDEKTLIHTGKDQNVKQDMLCSVMKIQNKGIEVAGGFIVGFDSDPSDIFERQINFIQQSGIVLAMVGLLTALPNTQLFRRLEKEGRLLAESTGNNTHDLFLNFKPKMELSTVLEGYKQIIAHIYSPKAYFERCLNFLQHLHPHQNYSHKVGWREIMALFKSIGKQGFASYYAFYYWRFLSKVLASEPKMFSEAVRLAIKGYHFFLITREIIAVDAFKTKVAETEKTYLQKIQAAKIWMEEKLNQTQMEAKIVELQKLKEKVLKDIRMQCSKVNADFRHLVKELPTNIEKNFNEHLNQLIETVPSKSLIGNCSG